MRYLLVLASLSLLCWGCLLPTVHPLFTEADVVFDPGLVGAWSAEDDTTVWTFAKGEGKSYRVTVSNDDESGVFMGHLAKIGEYRFLDIVPDTEASVKDTMASDFILPLHIFARVDDIGATVKIAVIDPEWVEKHLEAHPEALAHTQVDDGLLITASTADLRAFLAQHAGDPGLFTEASPYRKADATKTLPPYTPQAQ